jgi:hypothetical protein
MQIGIITVDGRPVGTISLGTAVEPELFEEDVPAPGLAPSRSPHSRHRHAGGATESHPVKQRFGGEGDTDTPAERKLDLPPSDPVSGDRVHGRFAEARNRARQELEEKPWLNEKAMHIFAGENPHPVAATALWESAINRAAVRGTSLEAQLRRHASSGKDEGGYYAGYNSVVSPEVRKTLEGARDRALNYSNVSGYATDNSSGDLAAREQASGSFLHRSTYNREHFFAPGSSQPVNREKWRAMVHDSETVKAAERATPVFDPQTMAP